MKVNQVIFVSFKLSFSRVFHKIYTKSKRIVFIEKRKLLSEG